MTTGPWHQVYNPDNIRLAAGGDVVMNIVCNTEEIFVFSFRFVKLAVAIKKISKSIERVYQIKEAMLLYTDTDTFFDNFPKVC